MKCETVQDNLVLLIYGELADDARFQMEKHLEGCSECTAEWQGLRQFHADASALPAIEPTPNLLAASRMRLQEALDKQAEQFVKQSGPQAMDAHYEHAFRLLQSTSARRLSGLT